MLTALLSTVRRNFGVAIGEVGDNDLWGNAEVGVACISTSVSHADSILQQVCDAFDLAPNLVVVEAAKEVRRV